MYGHKCQACIRLYKDEKVRNIIREHHKEKIADVFFAEWLIYSYRPEAQPAKESPEEQVASLVW